MKKKLKKKELEKVSGGYERPASRYLESKKPRCGATNIPVLRGTPTGSNSEQSEGNPGELPLPK